MDIDYVRYRLRHLAEARLQPGGLSKSELSLYEQLCGLERSVLVTEQAVLQLYEVDELEGAEGAI